MSVCRSCAGPAYAGWLELSFFIIHPRHALFWQLRFLPHIFFAPINISLINSLFVIRAGTLALSDTNRNLHVSTQNLIIVQHDEIYSVDYISVGSSACFGC